MTSLPAGGDLGTDREVLQTTLLVWMASWARGDEIGRDRDGRRFEQLAMHLFAFQFEHIAAYRAFCTARGATPDTVRDWTAIPLVPVTAFKIARLAVDHPGEPACVFETSGTTDGAPGRVELYDTACYDASLQAAFSHFVVPQVPPGQRYRCVSLVPARAARPHSSLGYMVQRLAARWDDGEGSQHLGALGAIGAQPEAADPYEHLDAAGCCAALERACRDERPVLLFATSIALELWLAAVPAGWSVLLPPGSRVMDTGGAKGRRITLTREEQHARLSALLGIDQDVIVGELGMTELCSQRYETTVRARVVGDVPALRALAGPPWLRARVLNPADRSPVQPGETGMIGHVDLANLDTCAFVLTADLGRAIAVAGHDGALELAGRIPGSEWRGCGLDAEELAG